MVEWAGMAVLFVCVAGFCFVALSWVSMRRSRVDPRLNSDGDGSGTIAGSGSAPEIRFDTGSRPEFVLTKDSSPDFVLGEITPALAKQIPVSQEDLAKLQPELVAAGFYSRHALTQYLAIRTAMILVPLLAAGVLALLLNRIWVPHIIIGGLALAFLGYSLPRVYINYLARDRKREIEFGLPVAIDLLALGVTAGQNILHAFHRAAQELQFSYPVLANELDLVYRQASLNTLPHALEQFADRVQIPEIRNLVMILTQSERAGTDISAALLEFASNLRTTLRQRADAQANRASFWMLFPTIFCLFVPAAVVVGGPIVFDARERYKEARRIKDEHDNNELTKQFAQPFSAPSTPKQ
jgi:tight adherence protein C